MEYSLKEHGDIFEKLFLPYLNESFPNYENFWRRFVTPITRRGSDGSLQLKRGIDTLLEQMCMAHYSIYYHLGFSHQLSTWSGAIAFQAIFFHLSAATEMVERFLFSVIKIDALVNKKPDIFELLDKQSYDSRTSEYWQSAEVQGSKTTSGYQSDFQRFRDTGQSANVRLHSIKDVISKFCEEVKPEARKHYNKWGGVANEIRSYRNNLTHNPRLGLLVAKDGIIMVPKQNRLKKYQLWSEVIYQDYKTEDFTPLGSCIHEYQSKFEGMTNRLWDFVIEYFASVSVKDEYGQMLQFDDGDESTGEGVSPPPTWTPPMPSKPPGTSVPNNWTVQPNPYISGSSSASGINPIDSE